jgi:hypothetical protein
MRADYHARRRRGPEAVNSRVGLIADVNADRGDAHLPVSMGRKEPPR